MAVVEDHLAEMTTATDQEKVSLDGSVNSKASWRFQKLGDAWGCSIAGVVERLVIEADEKYSHVLFPKTEQENFN